MTWDHRRARRLIREGQIVHCKAIEGGLLRGRIVKVTGFSRFDSVTVHFEDERYNGKDGLRDFYVHRFVECLVP